MTAPNRFNPWEHLHAHDVARFGDLLGNKEERSRWCSAILTGGLPVLWGNAKHIREMILTRLELKPGDRVLLIGESNETCGFDAALRERIGEQGELRSIDIIERARDMCMGGQRGGNGKLGTWRYTYTENDPDGHYDAIAVLQGVQHCEDWTVGSTELVRVLKPGGMIVMGEIAHGPYLAEIAKVDVHLEYYVRKLYTGTDMDPEDFSYWPLEEIEAAFAGKVTDVGTFAERGFEVFWGRKPA